MNRASAIGLFLLFTAPLWVESGYYLNILSQVLIWAMFALGLNILVGYGRLVSLGHAGLFGVAAYAVAWLVMTGGQGHLVAALLALGVTLGLAALFALLALRGAGIVFLMITLALGQIVWGVAYRWISLTNGDNGINLGSRPEPFGLSLATPEAFYFATFLVFVIVLGAVATLIRSPFGASLKGSRDQERRMTALGYHVWLIRLIAFLFSGLISGVAGIMFVYYTQFISPHALSLTVSAEALLMVISGGMGTLLGPIAGAAILVVMKNIVSAYVERWNFLLGAIFVVIVLFMPEGLVPGSQRLWRAARARLSARGQGQ